VRIVTWNVNSLKMRLPRVLELLERHQPDVVLLQETKAEPEAFAAAELSAAGYDAVHHSAGRWAGVAILARSGLGLTDEAAGLPGELRADEARWIEATVGGSMRVVSTYVTNGRAVGTEPFAEKLAFLDAMAKRAGELAAGPVPLVVGGDFNVTRDDRDVYDPAAFAGGTHVTPEERSRLEAIIAAGGLVDGYRALHDAPGDIGFTWWDYRQGHFHRGLGLRIDFLLLSESLAPALTRCGIERDFRKGSKPSDHAPLFADLSL
jgi:exodeoxyribonuclease-3